MTTITLHTRRRQTVVKDFGKKLSDYYNEEFYAKQMDDLNVLYVAMTRPKEKLFVCLGKKKTKSDEKNGKIIKGILSANE